jgi:hypothetical protein
MRHTNESNPSNGNELSLEGSRLREFVGAVMLLRHWKRHAVLLGGREIISEFARLIAEMIS